MMTAQEQFTALRQKVFDTCTAAFHATPEACAGGVDQVLFQGALVAALFSVATEFGMDAGMPREQMHKVLDAEFDTVDAVYPTWG